MSWDEDEYDYYDTGPDFEPFEDHQYEKFDAVNANKGYHGSSTDLRGSHIEPQPVHARNHDISYHDGVNYMAKGLHPQTTRNAENQAWSWAGSAVDLDRRAELDERGEMTTTQNHSWLKGRSRVYEVEAVGEYGYDGNLSSINSANYFVRQEQEAMSENLAAAHFSSEMTAPSLKVTRTEWIPPPSMTARERGAGVQGTLPSLNWKQFGAPNVENVMAVEGAARTSDMQPDNFDVTGMAPPWVADIPGYQAHLKASRQKSEPAPQIEGQMAFDI